jgi:hypothetical protein
LAHNERERDQERDWEKEKEKQKEKEKAKGKEKEKKNHFNRSDSFSVHCTEEENEEPFNDEAVETSQLEHHHESDSAHVPLISSTCDPLANKIESVLKTLRGKTEVASVDKRIQVIQKPSPGCRIFHSTEQMQAEFLMICRKSTMQRHTIDELLRFMERHSIGSQLEEMPSNVSQLDSFERDHMPYSGLYKFADDSSGTCMFFTDLLFLIGCMLSDNLIYSQLHFAYEESDVIAHPCNTEGWRFYDAIRNELEDEQKLNYKLLCPVIFADEYEKTRFRHDKIYAIYMTLANLPTTLLNSTEHKYVLALVPHQFPITMAFQHAVVQPLQRLERGCAIQLHRHGLIWACGSLFMLSGHNPGQAEVCEMTGVLGAHPSRWTYATKLQLGTTNQQDLQIRSADEDLKTINWSLTKYKKRSKDTTGQPTRTMAEAGLKGKSPLWDLVWFSAHFYDHLAACYMHFYSLSST